MSSLIFNREDKMTELKYTKAEKINLRDRPEYSEKWVQDKISEDPSILGLGDLILRQKERIQPGAGRLDVLLQDENEETRYEVEIQLGKTNESHIIRVIEYWDLEKRRNPDIYHVAVLVAEDVTSRFLNVINLFNGAIPLVALKMEALKIDDRISLIFTKVLDQRNLKGDIEPIELTNRTYWEKRGTKKTVELADDLLNIVHTLDPEAELKYNKFYIGLAHDGQPFNFVVFKPQKTAIRMEVKLPESQEIKDKLESAGLEILEYSSRNGRYIIRLSKEDILNNIQLITDLCKQAFTEFGGESAGE